MTDKIWAELASIRRQAAGAALNTILGGRYSAQTAQLLGLYKGCMREAAAYDLVGTGAAAMEDLVSLSTRADDTGLIVMGAAAEIAVELSVELAATMMTARGACQSAGQGSNEDILRKTLGYLHERVQLVGCMRPIIGEAEHPVLPPAMVAAAQKKIQAFRASLG